MRDTKYSFNYHFICRELKLFKKNTKFDDAAFADDIDDDSDEQQRS